MTIGQNLTCCKPDSRAAPILTPDVRDDDAASSALGTDQIHPQLPHQCSIDWFCMLVKIRLSDDFWPKSDLLQIWFSSCSYTYAGCARWWCCFFCPWNWSNLSTTASPKFNWLILHACKYPSWLCELMMLLPLPLELIKSIHKCLTNIQLTDFACL